MADRIPTWQYRDVVWRGRCPRPQAVRRATGADRRAIPPVVAVLASLLLLVWTEATRALPVGAATAGSVAYASVDGWDADPDALLSTWTEGTLADTTPMGDSAHLLDNSTGAASLSPLDAPALAGWYGLAAADYGVSHHLLRALHHVESNASPDGCVANLEGSGAVGPFQFKPATFGQYGVDANHDGVRDQCSFADALFSAARYLRALGAADLDSPATRAALTRYGTDPDRVLVLARQYRDLAAQRP
jgi:hypothetical protein